MFSIGDLAQESGIKVPTIRYYEQMALIKAHSSTSGSTFVLE